MGKVVVVRASKIGFGVLVLSLLACGGLNDVNPVVTDSIILKNGTGTSVTVIPSSGSPAGTVEYYITFNPLVNVDESTLRMNIIRDDGHTMNGSPITFTSTSTIGEVTASYSLPDNTSGMERTYTIQVVGEVDGGDPINMSDDRGTFTQAADLPI